MPIPTDRNAEADQSPLENDTLPSYSPNEATKSLYRRTSQIIDGAIPSKTPASSGDPFLGRIKARSVPPPHTVKTIKLRIARVEDINLYDPTRISLFLTPYSQSPMADANKVTILNRTAGPGYTSQKPLALVAKMSDSERRALESGRGVVPNTLSSGIRYLYYKLYANNSEYDLPSKVTFDPGEPSLGRIRADSVAPPHSLASIKRRISRVEETPALVNANVFADISGDSPLIEGPISIHGADGPGLSPDEPMAIVRAESPVPDGKYIIKNRTADIYWRAGSSPTIEVVYFYSHEFYTLVRVKDHMYRHFHWDITHDSNDNIFMTSPYAPSSWVGVNVTGSTVPVPWRLIPADGNFYYLTTDINSVSQNPLVPVAAQVPATMYYNEPGTLTTLRDGDQLQMWEFIRV